MIDACLQEINENNRQLLSSPLMAVAMKLLSDTKSTPGAEQDVSSAFASV